MANNLVCEAKNASEFQKEAIVIKNNLWNQSIKIKDLFVLNKRYSSEIILL